MHSVLWSMKPRLTDDAASLFWSTQSINDTIESQSKNILANYFGHGEAFAMHECWFDIFVTCQWMCFLLRWTSRHDISFISSKLRTLRRIRNDLLCIRCVVDRDSCLSWTSRSNSSMKRTLDRLDIPADLEYRKKGKKNDDDDDVEDDYRHCLFSV